MKFITKTEIISQHQENNLLFKTKEDYNRNSLKVTYKGKYIEVKELSNNLFKINETLSVGEDLVALYEVLAVSVQEEYDIMKTLRLLTERIQRLEEQQELLLEAVNERVPNKTFRQWLLVMEKNFGKTILDKNFLMGIQGESFLTRDK